MLLLWTLSQSFAWTHFNQLSGNAGFCHFTNPNSLSITQIHTNSLSGEISCSFLPWEATRDCRMPITQAKPVFPFVSPTGRPTSRHFSPCGQNTDTCWGSVGKCEPRPSTSLRLDKPKIESCKLTSTALRLYDEFEMHMPNWSAVKMKR